MILAFNIVCLNNLALQIMCFGRMMTQFKDCNTIYSRDLLWYIKIANNYMLEKDV